MIFNTKRVLASANKKKGFTLAELQIASIIAVMVVAAGLSLYVFYWRTVLICDTILDVYSNARVAIERMARDIRWASQVVSSHGIYTTNNSCIVLRVPSIDASGFIIPSTYDYIIYKLQGTDLYRIVDKAALSSRLNENREIAKYCASLSFSSGGTPLANIGNLSAINTVSIYAPLNKTALSLTGSGQVAATMDPTTTIRMRNK